MRVQVQGVSELRKLIRKAGPVAKKALPILLALAAAGLAALGDYAANQWPF